MNKPNKEKKINEKVKLDEGTPQSKNREEPEHSTDEKVIKKKPVVETPVNEKKTRQPEYEWSFGSKIE